MDKGDGTTVFIHFRLNASDGLRECVHQDSLEKIFINEYKARDGKVLHTEVDLDSERCVTLKDSPNVD
jgi:hypothetical protein